MPRSSESQRLAAVHATKLLGTPAEERFDRITRVAKRMFGVEFAFIDLVGEHIIWAKSAQGLDIFEAEKKHGYCAMTVQQDGICLVHDARTDPRLVGNPYVDMCVFYAGVPLKFRGENVGALCISDGSPRIVGEAELDGLRDLAVLAERELEIMALSEAQLALTKANSELEIANVTDVLTRCYNRFGILSIGATELRQHKITGSLGVALLDIDHFKAVNDTYGHPAGDEVLRIVAARFRAASRPTDAVGRYGGEEFLAVLPNLADKVALARVCERLRQAVCNAPIVYQGIEISVTCSVGAVLADDSAELDSLIAGADALLYRAKRSGRNRVAV